MSQQVGEQEEKSEKKPWWASNGAILGGNLIFYVAYYLLLLRAPDSLSRGLSFLFFSAVQFVFCGIMAIVQRRWVWFLAGCIIGMIGLATCFGFIVFS